jgi:hypothetical protein
MLRVLVPEEFLCEMLDPKDPGTASAIAEHLENYHVAAFLIRRRENGNRH